MKSSNFLYIPTFAKTQSLNVKNQCTGFANALVDQHTCTCPCVRVAVVRTPPLLQLPICETGGGGIAFIAVFQSVCLSCSHPVPSPFFRMLFFSLWFRELN